MHKLVSVIKQQGEAAMKHLKIILVAAIDTLQRQDNGLVLKLMNEAEWQTVSQAFQHQFRQM